VAKKKAKVSRARPRAARSKPVENPPAPLAAVPPPKPPLRARPAPARSPLRDLERNFEIGLSHPKVSVIIATHNGVDALWHCLFALKTQTTAPYEVILVDNASEDASVSFVRSNYPQVRILECQEDFGPAMAFNLGVKTATGHLVALLGPDTVVTPDWLGRMVKDFQKGWPRFGLLTATVRGEREGKGTGRTLNIVGNPVEGFGTDPQEAFCPGQGTVFFPRFLAPEGPFDADYFFCREDAYLGWKFHLSGHGTGQSLETKVFLKEEDADYPDWKTVYFSSRNRWLNLFLFYESGNLLKIIPFVLMEGVLRLGRSLGVGFSAFWGTLCAMVWIAGHPRLIARKRQAVQEKRKVPDRDILRYLSGRVVRDGGILSRALNLVSLAYCRLVGLEVLEWQ